MAVNYEGYATNQTLSVNVSTNHTLNNWHHGDVWASVLEDFKNSQLTLSDPSTVVLLTLYIPIFVLSLCGNGLVFLAVVPNQRMATVTNYFLVNLAAADLLGKITAYDLSFMNSFSKT